MSTRQFYLLGKLSACGGINMSHLLIHGNILSSGFADRYAVHKVTQHIQAHIKHAGNPAQNHQASHALPGLHIT